MKLKFKADTDHLNNPRFGIETPKGGKLTITYLIKAPEGGELRIIDSNDGTHNTACEVLNLGCIGDECSIKLSEIEYAEADD